MPLAECAYNSYQASIGMAPFEALYGRRCRSPVCWTEVEDKLILGPDLVREMTEKVAVIQQRLKTAQSRQKNYADIRRQPLEFVVGDRVFLKVSSKREVVRFWKNAKLGPRYVGPFEILERIDAVAYCLALSSRLSRVHDVFHVSMLRKYEPDPSHVIYWSELELGEDVTFAERPVQILDSRVQVLREKVIPLVRVLWRHRDFEEETWEREANMRMRFRELFSY